MQVQVTYNLSAQEVREVLFATQVLKPYKTKVIALAIAAVIIGVAGISPTNPYTYFNIIPLALIVLFFALGNSYNEKNTIRNAATGETVVLSFYKDYINVKVAQYDADWNILPKDVARIIKGDDLYIIVLTDARSVAVPKRVISGEPEEQKILETFDELTRC